MLVDFFLSSRGGAGGSDAISGQKRDRHSPIQTIENRMHQSNSSVNYCYSQWIYLDENKSIPMQWSAIALV
jgi:hypothetical protein